MKQLLRYLLSLSFCPFFCFLTTLSAQTTNLTGVVNEYYAVSDLDISNGRLTLTTPATSFNTDDEVLIIQVQGGSMDQTNSPGFGDIIDVGSTGLFERARVCSGTGNELLLQHSLTNSYANPLTSNAVIQVVKFNTYIDANITGTVTAAPWDGSKGGVLVLSASGTISLNADINLNGIGFRGGQTETMSSNCASFPFPHFINYFFAQSDQAGAKKGEGLIPYIASKEYGRGTQGNGGGGGNDHNAGGGGGANYGAGGQGGEKTTGGSFICLGDQPGIGGKDLQNFIWASNSIFLGAGGGAGNDNDGESQDGANGGGMLILMADKIEGNGFSINARGFSAAHAVGDAGSGGGAGGSILLSTNTFGTSPLFLDVSGGNGGNAGVGANCLGPGGGGGGGLIRTSSPLTANVTSYTDGGSAGIVNTAVSLACAGGNNSATDGQAGFVINSGFVPESNAPSSCVLAIHGNRDGISDPISEAFSLSVFPNPAIQTDQIFLDYTFTEDTWTELFLIDMKGRALFEKVEKIEEGSGQITVPISHIPSGIYFIRFITNGSLHSYKIIIQNT